jgi:hypothetical protein
MNIKCDFQKVAKISLFISFLLSLNGCSLVSQKYAELAPSKITKYNGEMITLPAQLRTISNKSVAGSYISCSEPAPDVALSDVFKVITGITDESANANKITLNNDLQSNTTALELAGRTQTVLLAREFLYRTCEAASNGLLDRNEVKNAHSEILKQITDLVETDKKKAEASALIASSIATGKLDSKLLDNVSLASQKAISDYCKTEFESCITKHNSDEKEKGVCRTNFDKCLSYK